VWESGARDLYFCRGERESKSAEGRESKVADKIRQARGPSDRHDLTAQKRRERFIGGIKKGVVLESQEPGGRQVLCHGAPG